MLVLQINDLEHILRWLCRIEYSGQLKLSWGNKNSRSPTIGEMVLLGLDFMTGLVWLFRAIKVITVLSVLVHYSCRIKVLASACIELHTVRKNIELPQVSPPPPPPRFHGGLCQDSIFFRQLWHIVCYTTKYFYCVLVFCPFCHKHGVGSNPPK